MRHWLLGGLGVVLVCSGSSGVTARCAAADEPARPNLVVLNIDDLGYADIGPFGSQLNRTPNLDRMAAEGRKFTCFLCGPGLFPVAGGLDDRLLSQTRAADSSRPVSG